MRYWWVNHNQTARQELNGGYLWSPKRESNNARSQFYNNMRIAAPGDQVVSFVNSQLGHRGLVLDFATGAPKPEEFGTTGGNWNQEGWQLPVAWQRLPSPFKPKPLIKEFRQWLPQKYFPIHPKTGNGSEKAYLCEISEELFAFVIAQGGGGDIRPLAVETGLPVRPPEASRASDIQLKYDASLDASEREQVVKARQGQGLFRARVAEIESCCRLTGVTNPTLLTASHIKPWRSCASTHERLDGANGLLLTPHVDRLFDRGLISFADAGDVLLSPQLPAEDLQALGLRSACQRNAGGFLAEQQFYLDFHRAEVFLR